jgi:hypothetical protein
MSSSSRTAAPAAATAAATTALSSIWAAFTFRLLCFLHAAVRGRAATLLNVTQPDHGGSAVHINCRQVLLRLPWPCCVVFAARAASRSCSVGRHPVLLLYDIVSNSVTTRVTVTFLLLLLLSAGCQGSTWTLQRTCQDSGMRSVQKA